MKKFAVCGKPIEKSKSPQIFQQFFVNNDIDAHYTRIKTDEPSVAVRLFREFGLTGMNVTTPLKKTILPYLDHLSESVSKIGATNTIASLNDELYGFNTDTVGISRCLEGSTLKNVLIIGKGGAGAAAKYTVSQISKNAKIDIIEARNLLHYTSKKRYDTIVVCVALHLVIEYLFDILNKNKKSLIVIADYQNTEIINLLTSKFSNIIDGKIWLKEQAKASAEYFFGREDFCKKIDDDKCEIPKKNIFITGFALSGKSHKGQMFAEEKKMNFLDLDALIEKKYEKTISLIFEREGEEIFRQYERKMLMEVIKKEKNTVIALGGGTLINPQNLSLIRENQGYVIYVYRQLKNILKMKANFSNRPLLATKSDKEVTELYNARKEHYFLASDLIIPND